MYLIRCSSCNTFNLFKLFDGFWFT
ncbi:MAG: hypothetical protein JW783_13145 [Bacteroidales bacterium]|nr:hypothetical protein [Bacteroidales bacterium]MBN2749550.1 hypothetical protein [Bacteroidales bacterium]